jgi:hypothetical protein
MKTNRLRMVVGMCLCLASSGALAQNGGGGFDPSRIQDMISNFQQRIAEADPAQLQDFAARFRPDVADMDPAQFQQMVNQFQDRVGQFQQGLAENFGNMDSGQFQQRRIASLREQLGITDDTEWEIVNGLIQKVIQAQQAVQNDTPRSGILSMSVGTNSIAGILGQMRNARGNANGNNRIASSLLRTSPEVETVQKAFDSKAPTAEMRAAIDKLIEVRKVHRTALEKAQADLRQVLTVHQEAVAAVNGLL